MDSENKAPLSGVQNKTAPNSRKPSQCPSDQCVVSVDDDIEMVQADWTTFNYDTELAGKVPPLPENKDRHLFVSYSSKDFDDVMAIVNQLEQRFHVSCIISERDFQSGKDIIANIKESINRSMKNVFMLTPNFIQSGFCKFERDVAFMTSIETGINNVIPVMLHECDVPTSLSTVTYIDAMLPGIDVPAKIIEALIQSANQILGFLHVFPKVVTLDSGGENLLMEHFPWRIISCPRNLPEEQLELLFQHLNTTSLVARYDLTRSCGGNMSFSFSVCLLVFTLICFTAVMLGLHIKGLIELAPFFNIYLVIGIPFVIWITSLFCKHCKRELSLQRHVSEAVSGKCLQFNCIPVVERSRQTPPTLIIMRYNFHDCQTYLAGLIRLSGRPNKDETPEEEAEAMIRRSISHLKHHLTPSLEKLPDAPYNRHNVRKSKMCLCQMIEAGLPLVNGPDPIV